MCAAIGSFRYLNHDITLHPRRIFSSCAAIPRTGGKDLLVLLILFGIKVFKRVGELVKFHLTFVWTQQGFVAFH